jgi:CRISP-associated protein Cas1
MIKRTLYFGSSCYLRKENQQLVVEYPEDRGVPSRTVPLEDVGVVILDNPQVRLSHALLDALTENNAAILSCNSKHLPQGLMLPIFSHHAFTEKIRYQINSSVPLRKNLWQQTIVAKIANQGSLLRNTGICDKKMQIYQRNVKSGDPHNVEGRAAAYYWEKLFGENSGFTRDREGDMPNAMLNYGYAVLLAVVARALVASGLLPSVGIHHRNKYNPWCLASDIMEPYRPYVDRIVMQVEKKYPGLDYLDTNIKKDLLQIPVTDIEIEGKTSPLMVGVQRTTASLSSCFEGTSRKLLYPDFN